VKFFANISCASLVFVFYFGGQYVKKLICAKAFAKMLNTYHIFLSTLALPLYTFHVHILYAEPSEIEKEIERKTGLSLPTENCTSDIFQFVKCFSVNLSFYCTFDDLTLFVGSKCSCFKCIQEMNFRVRQGSFGSVSGCCKAAPSSNFGLSPSGDPQTELAATKPPEKKNIKHHLHFKPCHNVRHYVITTTAVFRVSF
jgi:hypothetical protein